MSTTTKIEKSVIAKQKDTSGKKDVYLLGCDSEGIRYWLESPSWDCGWYWGFGYVETYQGNRMPSKAIDIDSHQHIDSSFIGKHEYYDFDKKAFVQSDYIHNIFDSPKLASITFTEKEGWTLSELFKSFYQLKESADLFGKGSSHITNNPCQSVLQNIEWTKHINEVMIPAVTKQIMQILSPK